MQQLVCLMAAGLAAHPFVALLDDGIQVALSERLGRVLIVEGFCTQGLNVREAANRRRLNRLAAAVYATARALSIFLSSSFALFRPLTTATLTSMPATL